jgi:hypothetical protein
MGAGNGDNLFQGGRLESLVFNEEMMAMGMLGPSIILRMRSATHMMCLVQQIHEWENPKCENTTERRDCWN